jgi:hypothetical protein
MNIKVSNWDGPNKRRERSRKRNYVLQEQRTGFIPSDPIVLSFAGALAPLEKALVNRGITKSEHIITVQSCQRIGGHEGDPILRKLIKTRDEHLPGMYIWPHSFHSFTTGYAGDKILVPAFTTHQRILPKWYTSPTFRQEMYRFMNKPPVPFDVLDIDFCGIFSEANGNDVVRLMHNRALADRGLLFVNHQKGRENPGGGLKLFDFLKDYFRVCEHFDVDSLEDREGNRPDFDSNDGLTWYFIRYVLVPIFYVCEAFNAGYQLRTERLVEYRDRNPDSQAGVVMLQWYFTFERLPSFWLQEGGSIVKFSEAFTRDRERLEKHLDFIAHERYPYISAID